MNIYGDKIFIIHSLELTEEAIEYEQELLSRNPNLTCYIPGRDTNQTHGDDILKQNIEGMRGCREAHVIWTGKTQGTLFDMGMAYAMGIPLKPVQLIDSLFKEDVKRVSGGWVSFFKKKMGGFILE